MKINFNLENIKYLKIEYANGEEINTIKVAMEEKRENDFIAVLPKNQDFFAKIAQEISLTFLCDDGQYQTKTIINDIYEDNDFYHIVLDNPKTLDYQDNREYYRILADYDCIYSIETEFGVESINAVTYDISAGGVSILTSNNLIPTRETSIIIFMPDRDLKTHLQFVRCETYNEIYKLSFIFTDLKDYDFEFLSKLCVKKQISQF